MIRSYDPTAGADTLPSDPHTSAASRNADERDSEVDSLLHKIADAPSVDLDAPLMLDAGDQVGRFVVQSKIGAGGMGIVYRAHDPELDRAVAIKLHRGLTSSNATHRMLREAKSMARLSHPNVLTVYEVGTHAGHVFIAMEYAEGGSLRQWLQERPRTWQEIVGKFVEAGRGLAAAHDLGLVHRDFKADNVLLDTQGRARVADFGLARAADDDSIEMHVPPTSLDLSPSSPSNRLTTVGRAVGTPSYMPPEQYGPGVATSAADQFAFCASLYEAVYDERPFDGDTIAARLHAILEERVREPPAGRAPSRLFPVIARGLRPEPEGRYPSMDALLAELVADPSARRRRLFGAFGLVAVTATTVWVATLEPPVDPCASAAEGLASTWNDARRSEVATAYDAAAGEAGSGPRDTALAALDRFAGEWSEQRVEACAATRVRGDQSDTMLDLRIACLDRGLASFDGLVRVLENADTDVVSQTDALLTRVPALDGCEDTERLTRDVPPPGNAATAAEVAELRAAITQVEAETIASKLAGALDRLEPLVEATYEVDYAPLVLEALYARAHIRERVGEYEGSASDYDEVIARAIEIPYDEYLPRAAAKQAFLLGVRLHSPREGARMLRIARAAESRHPNLPAQKLIEGVAGTLAREAGDLDGAVKASRRALDLRVEIESGDETAAWSERYQYAITLDEAGRTQEAGVEFARVIEMIETRYGPDDPRLASPLRGAAIFATERGDTIGGLRAFERRATIIERAHGEASLTTTQALRDLAGAYSVAGRSEDAHRTLDRAIAIHRRLPERSPGELAELLSTKGMLLQSEDRCDEALRAYAEADREYANADAIDGRDHVVSLQNRLKCVSIVEGDDAASDLAERTLELRREFIAPDSLQFVRVLLATAEALGHAERYTRALELTDQALASLAKQGETDNHLTALVRLRRHDALVGLDRRDEGEEDLRAARAALDHGGATMHERVEALTMIAKREWSFDALRPTAYEDLARARAIAIADGGDWSSTAVADIDAWQHEHPAAR